MSSNAPLPGRRLSRNGLVPLYIVGRRQHLTPTAWKVQRPPLCYLYYVQSRPGKANIFRSAARIRQIGVFSRVYPVSGLHFFPKPALMTTFPIGDRQVIVSITYEEEKNHGQSRRPKKPLTKTELMANIAAAADVSKKQAAAMLEAFGRRNQDEPRQQGSLEPSRSPFGERSRRRRSRPAKAQKGVPNPFKPGRVHGPCRQARLQQGQGGGR